MFLADRAVLTPDSTMRFRSRDEVEWSLAAQGYRVLDEREAPDRSGRELVFIAQRTTGANREAPGRDIGRRGNPPGADENAARQISPLCASYPVVAEGAATETMTASTPGEEAGRP